MKNSDIFWSSAARYLAGEMKPTEEKKFRNELQQDKEMENIFDKTAETWKRFDNDPSEKYKHSDMAWNQLKDRLENDGLLKETRHVRFMQNPLVLRIAAVILFVIAVGIPLYLVDISRHSGQMLISKTATDGNSSVDLPDGSRVYLNEGSSIVYPESFDRNRNVQLRGEAFFEVMSDPSNPFRVRSGNALITVLGTSFNVKESTADMAVEVLVRTGKVKVENEPVKQSVTLLPGQFARSTEKSVEMSLQEDDNYLAWKTMEFRFVNRPLSEVLSVLEQSYHVKISAELEQSDSLRLTSAYKEQTIDAILETISTAFSFRLEKEGKNYYLTQI